MTYPTGGDWWCEDSGRTPHRAPQGSLRCEVHTKEYKRYQDRIRAARARFARTHPGETYEAPPYAPSSGKSPSTVVLHPYEVLDLLSLREDLDAAVARVRRLQRDRTRPDEAALHLADLTDKIAALLQEFGERLDHDARARSPANATAVHAPTRTRPKQKDRP